MGAKPSGKETFRKTKAQMGQYLGETRNTGLEEGRIRKG